MIYKYELPVRSQSLGEALDLVLRRCSKSSTLNLFLPSS